MVRSVSAVPREWERPRADRWPTGRQHRYQARARRRRTGRVLDEEGEPLARAVVTVLRQQYVRGEKQLAPAGADQSDDRGQYRVFGLPPGDYFVSASAGGIEQIVRQVIGDPAARQPTETSGTRPPTFPASPVPATRRGSSSPPLRKSPASIFRSRSFRWQRSKAWWSEVLHPSCSLPTTEARVDSVRRP